MSNLEIVGITEDTDPTTRQLRIRLRARETKPRQFDINLKNATADQINFLQANVGAVVSIPTQEYFANGSYGLSMKAHDEEMFVLRPAEKIQTAKTVELETVKNDKPLFGQKAS